MSIIITTLLAIGWIVYCIDKMDDIIDYLNRRR
jgi:hypothetical protein